MAAECLPVLERAGDECSQLADRALRAQLDAPAILGNLQATRMQAGACATDGKQAGAAGRACVNRDESTTGWPGTKQQKLIRAAALQFLARKPRLLVTPVRFHLLKLTKWEILVSARKVVKAKRQWLAEINRKRLQLQNPQILSKIVPRYHLLEVF